MISSNRFEKAATTIATLNRVQLKEQIKNFRGSFKLDFSEEYLEKTSVDRLRHILLAAMVNAKAHN